jgi:hypothetical protein
MNEKKFIKREWVLSAAVLLVIFLAAVPHCPAQPADALKSGKIFRVSARFTASAITPATTALEYGYGPALQPAPGVYTARVLSPEGTVLEEFALADPRVWRGDEVVIDKGGNVVSFSGLSEVKERADADIIFPYTVTAARFRILEPGTGTIKADIDLTPAIDAFCRQYPDDPDCRSRTAGPGGIPSLPALGVLAVLLLAGAVAYRVLAKKKSS